MKEEEGKFGCDDEAKEVESPEMVAAGLVDFVWVLWLGLGISGVCFGWVDCVSGMDDFFFFLVRCFGGLYVLMRFLVQEFASNDFLFLFLFCFVFF